jgi:RNA polymerase sigma factor (sigma-70 family)
MIKLADRFQAERSDELARAMKVGDADAFQRFIELHRPQVQRISKRFCRWFALPEEDAQQNGILGLLKAARRFDPERGIQFSTFAHWSVWQACRRFGFSAALFIHIPDRVIWTFVRHAIALERMQGTASSARIRDRLEDLELLNPLLAEGWQGYVRATTVASLSDRTMPEYRQAHRLPASVPAPSDRSTRLEAVAAVRAAIKRLRPRDAQVVRLRYGLDGEEHTLEQIGQLMGLTRERVRQIQNRAERKLRGLLGAQGPPPRLDGVRNKFRATKSASPAALAVPE